MFPPQDVEQVFDLLCGRQAELIREAALQREVAQVDSRSTLRSELADALRKLADCLDPVAAQVAGTRPSAARRAH